MNKNHDGQSVCINYMGSYLILLVGGSFSSELFLQHLQKPLVTFSCNRTIL